MVTLQPPGPPSGAMVTFTAKPGWSDPAAGCLTTNVCHFAYHWNFAGTTLDTTTPAVTRSMPIGVDTVTVRVTVVGYAGGTVPSSATATTSVTIAVDTRAVVQVRTSVKSKILRVTLRSRETWVLSVDLIINGRRKHYYTRQVVAGAGGSFGTPVTLPIKLAGLRGRTATLAISTGMLADRTTPSPIYRTIWLQ
jgi:hypothetical protein